MIRSHLLVVVSGLVLGACASVTPSEPTYSPVVFIHGEAGFAEMWTNTIWRFESNGWPRDRLFALSIASPYASDDVKPQEGRTNPAQHTVQLAAEVERVRKITGADKVVLIGFSRGGYAIRDYIRNGAGKNTVSQAILGGTPNHGVWATTEFFPGREYNGAGPFLAALNAPQGPNAEEVTPGVAFMTIRSDNQDKYAQPDGRYWGQPKLRTNVSYDAPALKGAENVVLPGADHTQTALGPEAFAQMYRFLTGRLPATMDIAAERTIVLNGKVCGLRGSQRTNLPIAGAIVEAFEVSPETGDRIARAVYSKTTSADGIWGPFVAKPGAYYEFVLRAEGYAITHIYRPPFARSSQYVDMVPQRLTDDDKKASSVIEMFRPTRYLDVEHERISIDGKSPPGVSPGVRTTSVSTLRLNEEATRSLVVETGDQRVVVRTWPTRDNHYVRATFY